MSKKTFWWLVAATGTIMVSLTVIWAQGGAQGPIHLDPKRPIEERIDDLMSRMALKEKVDQLNSPALEEDRKGTTAAEKMDAPK